MNNQSLVASSAMIAHPGLPALEQPDKVPTLLWVDDSRLLLSLYRSAFESLGYEVVTTSSPAEALERLASYKADVAILDYDMPEMDGGTLASLMKDQFPMLPVILYSGNSSISQAASCWVDAVCAKGAPREELLATIERFSHKAVKKQGSAGVLSAVI